MIPSIPVQRNVSKTVDIYCSLLRERQHFRLYVDAEFSNSHHTITSSNSKLEPHFLSIAVPRGQVNSQSLLQKNDMHSMFENSTFSSTCIAYNHSYLPMSGISLHKAKTFLYNTMSSTFP